MIVALYARVSSDRQARQATIESQLGELRSRIAAEGHALLAEHEYVDDGFSGASLVRPGLERLRDAAAARAIDRIYVHAADRLARKYAYQALLHEELGRHGASVVFVHGGEGRSPEEEMLLQMQGVFAEYERAKMIERTRRGRLHRARAGQVSVFTNAPYGYQYVPRTDGAPAEFRVYLPEARAVREAFRWLVEEHASIREIARRMSTIGAVPRRGGDTWTAGSIHGMLANPAYAGRAEFGKREAVARGAILRPGKGRPAVTGAEKTSTRFRPPDQRIVIPVPPIVSEEVFQAAHEQLQRNRQLATRRATARRYLLQGLLRCGRCGYAVSGSTTSRGTGYYRCGAGAGALRCGVPGVRVDRLDEHVWTAVRGLLEDPARLVEEWTRRAGADGTAAALREQQSAARKGVQWAETQIRRLGDAYEAGVLELEDFQARMAGVKKRRAKAEAELLQAEADLRHNVELTAIISTFAGFRGLMCGGFDHLTWEQRQHIIRSIVSYVTLDETSATISYRIPASEPGLPPVGSAAASGGAAAPPSSAAAAPVNCSGAAPGGAAGGGGGKLALCSGRHRPTAVRVRGPRSGDRPTSTDCGPPTRT